MASSSTLKILALAQGGYEPMTRAAIERGEFIDEFDVDLLTVMNRQAATIADGQNLAADTVPVRAMTPTVSAAAGNAGNGTLTVVAVGPDSVEGTYTATCTSIRSNRGIFQIRTPANGMVGDANVGTEFESGVLTLLICDGATDFAVGDRFSIALVGGTYSGYSFSEDAGIQIASGVLAVPVNTVDPLGAQKQFAIVGGPAVLPAAYVVVANASYPSTPVDAPSQRPYRSTPACCSSNAAGLWPRRETYVFPL